MVRKVPSAFILSIDDIFLIAFLIVTKLVNIPPGQRSVTKGMFTSPANVSNELLACFFVDTNKIFLPDFAICFIAAAASSALTTVLCKSITWIPLRSINMYGDMFGFHFLLRCPKCTPAPNRSL